jgi:hypothetical protein
MRGVAGGAGAEARHRQAGAIRPHSAEPATEPERTGSRRL